MRSAKIYIYDKYAGLLEETDESYIFTYDEVYLSNKDSQSISLTLPLTNDPYISPILFPFFDGLIPEGWLLEIAERNWKLNQRDRMGLLLTCCKDTIGAISVIAIKEDVENE